MIYPNAGINETLLRTNNTLQVTPGLIERYEFIEHPSRDTLALGEFLQRSRTTSRAPTPPRADVPVRRRCVLVSFTSFQGCTALVGQ
ncbi:MAG TPA: hypothetical protein VFQ77_00385 [Pseudonocardiaceae bacterium]|nr:hypothetical protein [Pseudonocardiaceae bacterium]